MRYLWVYAYETRPLLVFQLRHLASVMERLEKFLAGCVRVLGAGIETLSRIFLKRVDRWFWVKVIQAVLWLHGWNRGLGLRLRDVKGVNELVSRV